MPDSPESPNRPETAERVAAPVTPPKGENTVFLMDASAFIHRAFHAIKNMSTKSGAPTGAAYGFTATLLKLLKESQPRYLGVIFDSRGKNRRHELYPQYKAKRPPMDPELASQLAPIREIVRALGLAALEKQGYEADDIIASLCRLAVSESRPVVIISGDKDFYQLLSPTVSMYDPDPKKNSAMTLETFKENFGIEPEAFLDVQALTGDTSDNIPGVPQVGMVKGLKLISQWGSLDNVYANLAKVTQPRTRKLLEENRESAYLSRTLAKLGEGLEPIATIEGLKPGPLDPQGLLGLFSDLEFNRFKNELVKFGPIWLGQDKAKEFVSAVKSSAIPTPTGASQPKPLVTRLFGAGSVGSPHAVFAQSASDRADSDLADSTQSGQTPQAGEEAQSLTAILVDSPEGWQELLTALEEAKTEGDTLSLSAETDSETPATALASGRAIDSFSGLALAVKPGQGYYLPRRYPDQDNFIFDDFKEKLLAFLEEALPAKVAHNSKLFLHSLAALKQSGELQPKTSPTDPTLAALKQSGELQPKTTLSDPMLAAYLLNPDDKNDLFALANRRLGLDLESLAEILTGSKKPNPIKTDPEKLKKYAVAKAVATAELGRQLEDDLKNDPALEKLYRQLELPLSDLLARVEQKGILVNLDALRDLSTELQGTLTAIAEKIYDQAGGHRFNLGSPKQLGEILFETLKLPTGKKTSTKKTYSTDNEVLSELALTYPIAKDVISHRELTKLKNTYADKLPQHVSPITGRIHTTFNQALTATGRLSSSEPNLQNIPAKTEEGRRIRGAFFAPEGYRLLSADYSQIELRIMAHFSGDKSLLRAFENDDDIHSQTAAEIFGLNPNDVRPEIRRQAKTINFGIIYGQGAYGLSKTLNISHNEAKNFIDSYFRRFPGVAKYMDKTRLEAAKTGFVTTWYGRKRYLPGIFGTGMTKSEAERMAINTPIQGTAADIIKMAMLQVDRAIQAEKLQARIILQVHDELVLEVPVPELETVSRLVTREMIAVAQEPIIEDARPLNVKLKVDVAYDSTWVHA